MDDALEGGKELVSETIRAFRTGMHGHDYEPGIDNSAVIDAEDQLAKLNELRESGTLNFVEYEAARKRLLSSHPGIEDPDRPS